MTISSMPALLSAQEPVPSVLCASPEPIQGLTTPQGLLLRLMKHPNHPRNLIDSRAAMQAENRYLEALKLQSETRNELPPLKRTKSHAGIQDAFVQDSHHLTALYAPSKVNVLRVPRAQSPRPAQRAGFLPPAGDEEENSTALALKQCPPSALFEQQSLSTKEGCRRETQSEGRHRSARLLSHWAEGFCHRPRAYAAALKLGLYLIARLEYPNLKRLHFPSNLTLGAGFEDLEGLPPRLTVYGNLRLENLPNFSDFGKRTRVHGDLVLTALPRLNQIPQDLFWKGGIRLASCAGLEDAVENTPFFEIY